MQKQTVRFSSKQRNLQAVYAAPIAEKVSVAALMAINKLMQRSHRLPHFLKKRKSILIALPSSLEKRRYWEDSVCHRFDRPEVKVAGGFAIPPPRAEPGVTLRCSSVIPFEFSLRVLCWREISPWHQLLRFSLLLSRANGTQPSFRSLRGSASQQRERPASVQRPKRSGQESFASSQCLLGNIFHYQTPSGKKNDGSL